MKRHKLDCPIAGLLNIFGDRWTLLIIRESFYGATRFSEFERHTLIAKNILSDRLSLLVKEEILQKSDIGENGTRYAYSLTDKGRDLLPILVAMYQWGNQHLYKNAQAPVSIIDRKNGQRIKMLRVKGADDKVLGLDDLIVTANPTASDAARSRLAKIT